MAPNDTKFIADARKFFLERLAEYNDFLLAADVAKVFVIEKSNVYTYTNNGVFVPVKSESRVKVYSKSALEKKVRSGEIEELPLYGYRRIHSRAVSEAEEARLATEQAGKIALEQEPSAAPRPPSERGAAPAADAGAGVTAFDLLAVADKVSESVLGALTAMIASDYGFADRVAARVAELSSARVADAVAEKLSGELGSVAEDVAEAVAVQVRAVSAGAATAAERAVTTALRDAPAATGSGASAQETVALLAGSHEAASALADGLITELLKRGLVTVAATPNPPDPGAAAGVGSSRAATPGDVAKRAASAASSSSNGHGASSSPLGGGRIFSES